ncbi:uncharacterized protein LOC133198909 isoform X1 [Saccostrea echinata]|uniref:uncharacterized protein LOC133198909 isoform X1 n=1 Tax=Saccostrea echinata TaxID=191078 RepID=UPI002A83E2EF|nr:uncharacterized protein LOC133198909 isoform X1 [Saccostrea echinata]
MPPARKRRRLDDTTRKEVSDLMSQMLQTMVPNIVEMVTQKLKGDMSHLPTEQGSPTNVCSLDVSQPPPDNNVVATVHQGEPSQQGTSSAATLPSQPLTNSTQDSTVPGTGSTHGQVSVGDPIRNIQNLKEVSQFLLDNALTVGTRNSYQREKLAYEEFLEVHFPGTVTFPIDVEHLVLFISNCYQKGLAPQTVRTYLSALAHFSKMEGHVDPTQNFVIKRTIQGFQNLKSTTDVRMPITPSILQKLVNSLHFCTSSFYEKCLFKAMFLLAFHAFLRIGEITSTTKSSTVLPLTAIQLEKSPNARPKEMILTLTNFKHHQGKPPVTFQITADTEKPETCAVLAMLDYLNVRGEEDGPLFMLSDQSPITRHMFNEQLKISLTFLGYDAKIYKGHSFRIGAA